MTDANIPLLVVDDLRASFPRRDGGMTEAVRGVSFTLGRERLGIVASRDRASRRPAAPSWG